jgi:hypothetical protein
MTIISLLLDTMITFSGVFYQSRRNLSPNYAANEIQRYLRFITAKMGTSSRQPCSKIWQAVPVVKPN